MLFRKHKIHPEATEIEALSPWERTMARPEISHSGFPGARYCDLFYYYYYLLLDDFIDYIPSLSGPLKSESQECSDLDSVEKEKYLRFLRVTKRFPDRLSKISCIEK